jgi:hypothetical protein
MDAIWHYHVPITQPHQTISAALQGPLMVFLMSDISPFQDICSWSHEQQWIHSRLSATFPMGSNGPSQGYRQLVLWAMISPFKTIGSFSHWATMGPFKVIGSFAHEQQWAHSRFSAAFLMCYIGPIQDYQQLFSWQ